jgi:murein DD-endopeptidase MepM/ murein hydrolase activator NlpD
VSSISRRNFLALAAGVGGAAALSGLGWLVASSAEDEESNEGLVIGEDGPSTATPSATPTSTPTAAATPAATETLPPEPTVEPTATATATADAGDAAGGEPTGYIFPMADRHVPAASSQLPNAPREYRCGSHEGLDFYPYESGPFFGRGEPVWAAKAGEVIRVDHQYTEYTTAEREADLTIVCSGSVDAGRILDRLRGRQVWISHDDGHTTRYCHLTSVEGSLSVGQRVEARQVIGGAGNSGTSNGAAGTEMDIHLHFELRLGGPNGPYLGAGQPESEVRRLLEQLFSA